MKKLLSCFMLVCIIISCFALNSCGNETAADDGLTKARNYVFEMYKNSAEATNADYSVTSVVNIDGVQYKVSWSVDVTEGVTLTDDGKTTLVDVDEYTTADIAYVLKGVVSDEKGNTEEVSFSHTIPAFKEYGYAEYAAAADDTSIVVRGIVTGIIAKSKGNSNNCLYLQDDVGGFYAYALSEDPAEAGIKEGMTVRVTGAKDTYSGTLEIASPSVEIIDSTVKTVTPVDYTEIFKNATSLKDTALVEKQALLVTIKGVEITGEDTSSGYYKFKLGNLETYIRISSSVCPLASDDQTSFKTGHAEHLGWTGNATGVICLYDGAFYLTPVSADAFEYVSKAEKSDAEKVAFEKDALTLTTEYTAAGETELSATGKSYTDVKVSWASASEYAKIDGSKLKITMPAANTEVKITATLKCGTETATKEFTVKLTASTEKYDVAGVLELMKNYASKQISDKQVTVTGVAVSSSYNSKYGSYTVWLKNGDTENAFELYSVVPADGLDKEEYHTENALSGYTITCTGYLQLYNTAYEMCYLSASQSPTGAAVSPVISDISK